MHILAGLLLIVIAFGAVFIIVQTDVFDPVAGPLGGVFGVRQSTSTPSNLSEYHQEARIQFVATGSGLDKTQVVTIVGNPTRSDGINVTGWTLRIGKDTYPVPKAQNIYSPSVEGVPPEDVYLREGGIVNFYSGKNPQKDQSQAIRAGLNEWRIWLGKDFLPVPHGTVILRDTRGKVVDEYKY